MSTVNICVYAVVFRDGRRIFEFASEERLGGFGVSTIREMARIVREEVNSFLNDGKLNRAFIDFSPHHDVVCSARHLPRLCLSLTAEEREDFWKFFAKD